MTFHIIGKTFSAQPFSIANLNNQINETLLMFKIS